MCGIAGIYMRDGRDADAGGVQLVSRMTACMTHRGPIETGFHNDRSAILGMARLSIIDVVGGHQPIYNEDRTLAVVFNGQIYNYVELMAELKAKGHVFATHSDTEVLVHLYEEEGPRMLERLNGMFVLAIHDMVRKTVFVARDRLGVKPLYYSVSGKRVLFASEMKALLLDPELDRTVDPSFVTEYLALMYARAPRTPFKHIVKLEAGHYVEMDAHGVRTTRWWTPEPDHERLSYEAACERLRELLDDAVRLRLRSDVPVGSLLSGGLDSSAVTALAARRSERSIDTFTVSFSDTAFDETPFAAAVAEAYGTNHTVQSVSMHDAIDLLPLLIWHLDEPIADSAIIPTYMISKLAASRVRVALCGAGGDELFGGYPRYFEGRGLEHLYRQLPVGLRKAVLSPLIGGASDTWGYRARMNDMPQPDRFLLQSCVFSPDLARGLTLDGGNVSFAREYADTGWADDINRLMLIDMKAYLTDDILHLTDRMSMAASLEIREPLLDHRLVSFALGLPGSFKVDQTRRIWKRCLKDAVSPLLPPQILSRPKWGFGGPVANWMKSGVETMTRQLYRDSSAFRHGLLDPDSTLRYFDEPQTYDGVQRYGRLWALLILELWSRVFLDNRGEKPTMRLKEFAA